MPSGPAQLAGLSLEPVCQREYLTASAAPGGLTLRRRMRGASTNPLKREERESPERRGEKKSDHIRVAGSDSVTTLVTKPAQLTGRRRSLLVFTGREERESSR